jgi:16S rRNA C967 or C1407 C5-methylase (RsmB/RsmF family)
MQTMALMEATSGRITAVDKYDEYLDELREKLKRAALSDRVEVKNADMAALVSRKQLLTSFGAREPPISWEFPLH